MKDLDRSIRPSGVQAGTITRRALLAGTAMLWVAAAAPPAFAEDQASGARPFHVLSLALTGKGDLSPLTAGRIYEALLRDDAALPGEVATLSRLAQDHRTPEALKTAASEAGLGDLVMKIVTAWYTGTVETAQGPVVVAYAEALMYRPTADGLTVPTYCSNGPLWWSSLPPGIDRMPANLPRVL